MKMSLGDLNSKIHRKDIFRPTAVNESLHEISNDNGIRVVKFGIPETLIIKNKMFPHRNIHKFTWISRDGKTIRLTAF
jgi:uncharacterized membrane protein